jgi:hypothetical protein
MSSVSGTFLNQENIIKKVFDDVTNSLRISGSITVPAPIGGATEAKQDTQITTLNSIDSKLTSPLAVTGSLVIAPPQIYTTSALIDAAVTNIPGNASLPLQLIASTAQVTVEIQSIDDIGEYMALYTGPASSEVLLCALPLGGGEVKVNVPAATRISIKSLKSAAITNSNLIINLLK